MINLINAIAVGLAPTCLTIVAIHAGLAPFAAKLNVSIAKQMSFKIDVLVSINNAKTPNTNSDKLQGVKDQSDALDYQFGTKCITLMCVNW